MKFQKIIQEINKAKKIGVTFHTSPDGDAVGSALSLLQALRELKKEAVIFSKDKLPENLGYLNFSEEITGENYEVSNEIDLLIVLDCGNVERISANIDIYNNPIINIDHHASNDKYGIENYVDITAAATCEIVYDLIRELNVDIKKEIAETLYTGLVTDTGSFRHSNVTTKTHEIASYLIGKKINNSYIHTELFDNKEYSKMKLIGKVLDDMRLVKDNKVAIMRITQKMVEDVDALLDDTSDIISFGLKIQGVEIALLFKESDNNVKVSLRSKTNFNVRAVAEKFGGGGHEKASGMMVKNATLKDAENLILNAIGESI